jgi:GTPase SAR1 family protein
MAKYGKKNIIKIDPLAYNICLLGEPKIGKTTVIKEMLENLVGENGYMFLEMAGEAGADAINGIIYEDVDDWEDIEEIIDDIELNRNTDYAELKAIVADTYDGWIKLAEKEAIRLWNKDHPDKKADSIDAAWNGFQKGQAKAFELMFDVMVRLRKIGISMVIIGHVKNKELTDIATGTTYQTLTSDVEKVYFNLLKKKMHFIGLAYYDRKIITEKTGKRNIVTKKEETINRITEEIRKIKFRDDNMALDSGSRFADIVEEIPLDANALITALEDAIKAEFEKNTNGKSIEEAKKEQETIKEEKVKENLEQIKLQKQLESDASEFEALKEKINNFIKENKATNPVVLKPVLKAMAAYGYKNPLKIETLEHAQEIADLIVE